MPTRLGDAWREGTRRPHRPTDLPARLRRLRVACAGWFTVTTAAAAWLLIAREPPLATPVRAGIAAVVVAAGAATARQWQHVSGAVGALTALTVDLTEGPSLPRPAADRVERRERIQGLLTDGGWRMAYQPIVDLRTGDALGYEALARFDIEPSRPPNVWFAEAGEVGLGPELEIAAFERATAAFERLPAHCYLAVNVSPSTFFSPYLLGLLDRLGDRTRRIVLEITEHAAVEHYAALARVIRRLRGFGIRVAVDDAGAGFASFQHVLNIQPDVIKLDRALTTGIDRDPQRRALAAALVEFAGQIGSEVCAEGIERPEEAEVLARLGVQCGQGYLFAAPAPLEAVA